MRYEIGTQPIPGYRIVEFLGEGSYGAVYKARGPGGVENALKFIRLDNKQGLKEFKSVSLVKKLRHANLVPIHAIWLRDASGNVMSENTEGDSVSINLMGDKELVIAMGLGDQSLAQRLEESHGKGIPLDKLIRYMEDSAKGIDYLNEPTHEPNNSSIIHCDIKPGNLLLVGGSVQVCDYGVAKALSKGGDFKKTMGAGTPAYAAPELINNDPCTATDQYSLAITYYELRTGRLPFDEAKALVSHLTGRLDFSLLDPAEQQVIRRATHMQPTKRYPTCLEMVEELKVATGITLSRTGAVPQPAPRRVIATTEFAPGPVRTLNDLLQKGAELVPDHRLVRLLGHGGYGQVWEATGPGDVPCALKIVRDQEAKGKQEFEILNKIRKLKHPNLLQLRGYWLLADDGSRIAPDNLGQPGTPTPAAVVISTDLAEKNLLQRMRECQEQGMSGLAPAELIDYFRQAAAAVDYLNANHIQHRDIKPENILLSGSTAYVSDFGLAKLVEGDGGAVTSSSSAMTLDYAAPELLQKRVTLWTDQYSLALTYVTLRTGRPPFPPHASLHEKIQARISGQLDLSAVSPAEREVLEIALNREPDRRFDNCLTLANRLAAALGLDLPPLPTASSPHAPISSRDSNLGRTSSVPPMASTVRSTPFPQTAMPLVAELRPDTQRQADQSKAAALFNEYKGTVLFSDTAPMPSVPPPAAGNPWKTDPPGAPQPGTTPWQEQAPVQKRGMPVAVWLIAALLLLAGAAGGFFLWKSQQPQAVVNNQQNNQNQGDGGTGGTTPGTSGSGQPAQSSTGNAGGSTTNNPGTTGPMGGTTPPSGGDPKNDPKPDRPAQPEPSEQLKNEQKAILERFAKGEIQQGLEAIKAFEARNPPAELRNTTDVLKSAWALFAQAPSTADELKTFIQAGREHASKLPPGPVEKFNEQFRQQITSRLQAMIPTLNDGVNWQALAEACTAAEPGPAIAALKAECWREIQAAGAQPTFQKPDLAANEEPLALYLRLLELLEQRQLSDAQPLLEVLLPRQAEPAAVLGQSPRRGRLLVESVASATRARRRKDRQQLAAPFTKEDAPVVWKLAGTLLDSKPLTELLPPAKRNELYFDVVLAGWMVEPAGPRQALLVNHLNAARKRQEWQPDETGAVQFAALLAASRPDTPDGRRERMEAYRDLLTQAAQGDVVPRAFVYEQVLKPLSSDAFADSLVQADAALKAEAARLLAGAAHDLRDSAEAWRQVESLSGKPLEVAIGLLDRAADLHRQADYAAWRGIYRSELPEMTYADLRVDLAAAETADPNNPLTKTLAGLAMNVKARDEADHGRRLGDYRNADRFYRGAIELCERERELQPDARRRELGILYKHAADNLILLANADQSNLVAVARYLKDCIAWADRLIDLEPQRADGFDTRGCALEDEAWLLRDQQRFDPQHGAYAKAVRDFQQAIGGDDLTGSGQRTVARMHLGRCLYKWAEDKVRTKQGLDDALLRRAEADLETAFQEAHADALGIRVESRYWLGCCRMLRHESASPAEAKTLYATATEDYQRALELTARGSGKEWFDLAATGLAFAHVRHGFRLIAAKDQAPKDRNAAEEVIDRLHKVINGTQPRPLEPIWKARLELIRLDMLAQLAPEPDRFPDIQRLVDEIKQMNPLAQHRFLQVQALLFRSDAYSSLAHYKKHHAAEPALRDAADALELARNADLMPANIRAEAFAKFPSLKYAAAVRDRISLEKLSAERGQLEIACALAPEHVNAATWRFQAGAIAFREEFLAEENKNLANRDRVIAELITAAVSHFAEVGRLAPTEASFAKHARKLLEDQRKNFRERLQAALESGAGTPIERSRWKLSDFELLCLSEQPSPAQRQAIQQVMDACMSEVDQIDNLVLRRELELQMSRVQALIR